MPLSREDWIDAAVEALREGGVGAVAALPLAARLGATRGSFYWHFGSRDELLAEALSYWENEVVTPLLERLAELPDPQARLQQLMRAPFDQPSDGRVLAALHDGAQHEVVAEGLHRITGRYLDFLTSCFRALGCTPALARRRALAAHAAYSGTAMLHLGVPDALPRGAAGVNRYVDDLVGGLVG